MLGLYKIENYIDIFELTGIVDSNIGREENKKVRFFTLILIVPIFIISTILLLISVVEKSPNENIYWIVYLMTGGLAAYNFTIASRENTPYSNFFKKIFKNVVKKEFKINLENKEFKKFIKENFKEIRNKKLSKEETIKYVNNWRNIGIS